MIKYNNNTINDWNFGTSNIKKVYRNNAIIYQKIVSSSPTLEFIELDDIITSSTTATTGDGIGIYPRVEGLKKVRIKVSELAYGSGYCWIAFGQGTDTSEVFALNNESNNQCSGYINVYDLQDAATDGLYSWLTWADTGILELDLEDISGGYTLNIIKYQANVNTKAYSFKF